MGFFPQVFRLAVLIDPGQKQAAVIHADGVTCCFEIQASWGESFLILLNASNEPYPITNKFFFISLKNGSKNNILLNCIPWNFPMGSESS